MATNKRKTRRELYTEILEQQGIRLEDCNVISFTFISLSCVRSFHYDLMMFAGNNYILFDSWENHANVVVLKTEKETDFIEQLAANNAGEKTAPNLY